MNWNPAKSRSLPLSTVELDVCGDASVNAAVQRVLAEYGHIDVLVNNAGVGYMAVVEELKMEDLKQQFETNLFGVLRVTQAVLPGMRVRRSGRIVMLSSVAGLVTPPTYGAYSSSKHALEGLSNALRVELYPFRIAVILIEPGYIRHKFSTDSYGSGAAIRGERQNKARTQKYTRAPGQAQIGNAAVRRLRRKIARA